jgi:hypothetical protein
MKREDIREALNTLAKMAKLELAVADFYGACSQQWVDDSHMWSQLSSMEVQHAQSIKKLADAVRDKPDEFKVVRFVNQKVLDTVSDRVNKYADKVRIGSLSKKEAVIIAQNTESSVLEMLFTGVFEAETEEFLRIMKDITSETKEHKAYFDKQVEEMKVKTTGDAGAVSPGGQEGDAGNKQKELEAGT